MIELFVETHDGEVKKYHYDHENLFDNILHIEQDVNNEKFKSVQAVFVFPEIKQEYLDLIKRSINCSFEASLNSKGETLVSLTSSGVNFLSDVFVFLSATNVANRFNKLNQFMTIKNAKNLKMNIQNSIYDGIINDEEIAKILAEKNNCERDVALKMFNNLNRESRKEILSGLYNILFSAPPPREPGLAIVEEIKRI